MYKKFETELAGRKLTVETGRVAEPRQPVGTRVNARAAKTE